MALAISVGTASVAAISSPFNTLPWASAHHGELPLFSGFAFRSIVFVLALGIWAAYLAWYARHYRTVASAGRGSNPAHVTKWKQSDIWVLVAMNAGMAAMILGGVFLEWGCANSAPSSC